MNTNYVLITGASSGLGKAFALQCAKMGFNLILTDMPGTSVQSIACQLKDQYNVAVLVYEFDLTNSIEMQHYLGIISSQFRVSFIISNAGIGGTSPITDTSLERIEKIISLNVKSMAILLRIFIPHLLMHKKSYILNVSSMAAFTPIAYKNVYPASKAFISSFSLGLRQELSGTGISVSVLYPGPMMTNYSISKRILSLGRIGKIGLFSTDEIARIAIKKTLARKSMIIPGIANKVNFYLMKVLPVHFKLWIVSNEIRRESKLVSSF